MQNNKIILITGATSGVGYHLATNLLAAGHTVIATGRNEERLTALEMQQAITFQADLSCEQSLDDLINFLPMIPDVVIFSAGIGKFSYAADVTDKEVEQTMMLNVTRVIQLTKRLVPMFLQKKQGQFIFIGSQAGKVATPKTSVYAASKHALIGYTNALRMELKNQNIVVTTIHPGPIDTPFLDNADGTGHYRQSLGKHLLSVEDVVTSVVQVIGTKKREVNVPKIMGITSKLYMLMPSFVEKIGHRFFYKK